MYILGINAYHGDSSACLFKDGLLICAIEEERINRTKHWAGFPSESIKFCLQDAGITIRDIDYITISRDSKANLHKKILHVLRNSTNLSAITNRIKNAKKISSLKDQIASSFNISSSSISAEIYNIEHHRSHMASSFFASPFAESAILSIDGFGDFTSTMTAIGKSNKIKKLKEINYPHSLGIFYTAVTQFLGFPDYGDEYKVMGLAPYGRDLYSAELLQIIQLRDNGSFKLNKKYFRHFTEGISMNWIGGKPIIKSLFNKSWENLLGEARIKNEELNQLHFDIAASTQKIAEMIVFHILNHLHKQTNCDNICIAGGVAQNSVINGKILENTPFKNIYIPAAGHDAGTSIGSALFLYNQILGNQRIKTINSAYLGSKFSDEDIIDILKEKDVNYRIFTDDELFEKVVDRLVEGAVVGWFQGRSEFGPRALGNRSILVDPRREDAKDLLNKKIKMRETFRPFAPSILKSAVSEYFVQDHTSPFMDKVFEFRKEKQKDLPAVTHVDGTGRLQSVDKEVSPRYYRLISKFAEKTGVPILLNTSFNENEPIVNRPEEALDCFLRTKMDILVMGNIVVER